MSWICENCSLSVCLAEQFAARSSIYLLTCLIFLLCSTLKRNAEFIRTFFVPLLLSLSAKYDNLFFPVWRLFICLLFALLSYFITSSRTQEERERFLFALSLFFFVYSVIDGTLPFFSSSSPSNHNEFTNFNWAHALFRRKLLLLLLFSICPRADTSPPSSSCFSSFVLSFCPRVMFSLRSLWLVRHTTHRI